MRARARKNKKSIVNYCKKCWYTEQFCASTSFFMVCHILKNDRNSQTIAIEGMHCQHCVGAVKEALAAVAGVTSVVVSLENNNAVVEGTGLDDAVLKAAVEDTGFDVTGIN